MHPHQEQQQAPTQQPVYYVPVQQVPVQQLQPPAAQDEREPRWVEDLRARSTGQSVALAFVALLLVGNLVLTFLVWRMIDGALHPFGG